MKAAIYSRVSTDEQTKGASLDVQEERGRAFAQFQGWEIVGVFRDPGVSALSTAPLSRPGFTQAVASSPEVLLVYDWTRFSRNQPLGEMDYRALQDRGIRIVSVTEPGDDPFMRGIHLLMAEKVARDMGKKSLESRQRLAREGIWCGGDPPFGHRVEDRRLAIDDQEASTVRRAAALLLRTGTTLTEVANVLNDEGHLPRQWNPRSGERRDAERTKVRTWDSESLRRMLANESLVGRYTWGKTKWKRASDGRNIVTKGDEAVVFEVPSILDADTFALVQEHLRVTSKSPSREFKTYPLSQGRLISPCGLHCSGMWVTRKGRRYYRCKGKEGPASQRCSCPYYIEASEIEDRVWWAIVPLLEDPKRLLELTGLDKEDDAQSFADEVKRLDARIADLDEALTQRVADALAAGMLADRVAKVTQRLEDDLATLRKKRDHAAQVETRIEEKRERRVRLNRLARASLKLLNANVDLEFQKQLLAMLDVRAYMDDAGDIKIKGVLREDLPFALNVHSERSWEDRQTERRPSR
jgi:site-specific DNA recombinase